MRGRVTDLCDVGVTVADPGDCVAAAAGVCAWEIIGCPEPTATECRPEECGPEPEVDMVCPTGEPVMAECALADDGACGWDLSCP